jgi:carboxypeptidase family protein
MKAFSIRLASPLIAGILLASTISAQGLSGTGTISGTVQDPSGAAILDADVTVEDPARGVRFSGKTNHSGLFSITGIAPGTEYSVIVSKPGFAEHERSGVEVDVGQNTSLVMMLTVAPARTSVSVDDAAPVVDHTKTGISQVVRSSQILNLPMNGRRVDRYVLLTPAVVPDGVLGLVAFRGIAGGNAFLTDGNDTSNQFFHENAGRTRIPTQISQDAVQEFQVLSSGYSAEYGRASGGIINTVTRSGSNIPFGTAYWFFRNRTLNARDPYSAVNPPEWRHQAGGSIGGKLIRDRLFYFVNTEIHRRSFPLVASLARPPLFDATGRFAGSCDASAQQCAAARGFLDRHFQVLDRTANTELGFGRLDWIPWRRHHLSASFNYLRFISPNGLQTQAALNNGEGVGDNGDSSVRTRYGRLSWSFGASGSSTNELRFGWFKDRHSDQINEALVPPETGLVQIAVAGQPFLGIGQDLPRIDPSENRFELADTFQRFMGGHTLKFGVNLIRTQDYVRYLQNRHGSYEYADFTSFAQDFSGNPNGAKRWQTYSQRFGNEIFDEVIGDAAFFVHDQYRFRPNVTFNYGLRYEYARLPQPPQPHPEYPQYGRIPSATTNLAPRFGVAVAFNQAKTVARAGYGVFFARYHSGVAGTFFLENGSYQQSMQIERRFLVDPQFGPVFPNPLPALNTANLPGPSTPGFASAIDLTFPSPDYRNPYTQQGDLGIEHAFSAALSAGVSYLWSRGLHLTTVRDLNIGPAGTPVTYRIEDGQGRDIGPYLVPAYRLVNRVNPRWRRVNLVESGGNSYYNAFLAQVRRRMSKRLEGFVSYTWSHAIDFNQGGGGDNIFYNDGPRSLWNGDYRADKASSQLDQRHRLVIGSIYEPGVPDQAPQWVQRLLSRWRISQISTFASAQPVSATMLITGVPFPGAAFNSTLNGFGGSPRVPFYPANSLDVDQVARTDARLTRIFAIRDRHQLHINFEAFNVFNHVSDTAVNTLAFEARDGVIRPLPNLGIGVASQGYPDGTNARRAQVSLRFIW